MKKILFASLFLAIPITTLWAQTEKRRWTTGRPLEVINHYCFMATNQVSFNIINIQAAGINVGSRTHMVAIDQNKDHVREVGVYTKDHQEMITDLHQQAVTTIAMESTGSYWQTLCR